MESLILVEQEKCPKITQKVSKINKTQGLFIKNGEYRFKIWFIYSFYDEIQFKEIFNIIFSEILNSKKKFQENSIKFF